jgi:hypothetical protein
LRFSLRQVASTSSILQALSITRFWQNKPIMMTIKSIVYFIGDKCAYHSHGRRQTLPNKRGNRIELSHLFVPNNRFGAWKPESVSAARKLFLPGRVDG